MLIRCDPFSRHYLPTVAYSMAKAHDKTKEAEAATQSMCDYLRLRKVWFDDKKPKSKADKKLKVSS